MSNLTTLPPETKPALFYGDLAATGERTRLALQSAVVTSAMTAANLIIAGHELLAAKQMLGETRGRLAKDDAPRGTWAQYLELYTVNANGKPCSETWAAHLMKVAKGYKSAMEARADSPILALMERAPSSLNDDERGQLLEGVRKFAGDRSLAQCALELGAVGSKAGTAAKTGETKPQKETRPPCWSDDMWAEYEALKDGSDAKIACLTLGNIVRDLLPVHSTEADMSSPHLAHLPPSFIVAIHAAAKATADRLAAMLPRERKKAEPEAKALKGKRDGRK